MSQNLYPLALNKYSTLSPSKQNSQPFFHWIFFRFKAHPLLSFQSVYKLRIERKMSKLDLVIGEEYERKRIVNGRNQLLTFCFNSGTKTVRRYKKPFSISRIYVALVRIFLYGENKNRETKVNADNVFLP